MKKSYLFLCCCFIWGICQAGISFGLPEIFNYSKDDYLAGTQNWDMVQGADGRMYFANNEGLLVYDGTHWNTYPLPNKTIVRSVAIGPGGRIFVGGQEEIGYFSPDNNGQLVYHSLLSLVPVSDRSFADVWDAVVYENAVFFRTSRRIFQYSAQKMTGYAGTDWRFLGVAAGLIIAQDAKKGLLYLQGGFWKPWPVAALPLEDPVTGMLGIGRDSILITTLKHGCYMVAAQVAKKWETPALRTIYNNNIYAAALINNNQVVLATSLNGCYVVDKQGEILFHLSRKEGLQNNNVLCAYVDRAENLWLGLDNGIDLIAYTNAIRHIYPDDARDASGYSSIIYDDKLYLGTSKGLFYSPLQPGSYDERSFAPVSKTGGQVWNLSEVNGKLLLGHHEGSFIIENNEALLLDQSSGFWTFLPLTPVLPSPVMVAGTYNGLSFYNYRQGDFSHKTNALFQSARFVVVDGDNIWVSHPYKGIFRLKYRGDQSPAITSYKKGDQSAPVNHCYIFKIKHRILISTEEGIFEYQPQQDRFVASHYFNQLFGRLRIRYMKEDAQGNIWFVYKKNLAVADFSGAQPALIYIPELNNKMVSGFEHVNPVDAHNIFVGGQKGFYHINFEKYKQLQPKLQAGIRAVYCHNKKDSLLFGGYTIPADEGSVQGAKPPAISYAWNTVRFEYSSTFFGQQANIEYSYRLKGFEKNWSDWSKKTDKEFTNLPAGNYRFELKSRNNLGNESAASAYRFSIQPPWYESWQAFIVYFLLALATIYLLYRYQRRKFRRQQLRYEEEQKQLQYLHNLELEKNEKQIVQLKNEKLEAEIHYKNKELASAAMHLVQKGELLDKIKEELIKINKLTEKGNPPDDVKKIIRKLNEEKRLDEDWEHFSLHFDKVHSDFLLVMKRRYPNLTPNELKLCAYLRMNLSTKEIAQLMNISVRGVEISRYRLRKKLNIPTEMNLFHFLLKIAEHEQEENMSAERPQ